MPAIFDLGLMEQPTNRGFIFTFMPQNINGGDIPDMFTNKKLFMVILDNTEEIGDVLHKLENISRSNDLPEQKIPKIQKKCRTTDSSTEEKTRMIFAFPGRPITLMDELERQRTEKCCLEQLGFEFAPGWMTNFPALMYADLFPGPVPCQTVVSHYRLNFPSIEDNLNVESSSSNQSAVSPTRSNLCLCTYLPFMVTENINRISKKRVKWICILHEHPESIKVESIRDDEEESKLKLQFDSVVPDVDCIRRNNKNKHKTRKHFEMTKFLSNKEKNHIRFKLVSTIKQTMRDRLKNKMKWRKLCEKVANYNDKAKVII